MEIALSLAGSILSVARLFPVLRTPARMIRVGEMATYVIRKTDQTNNTGFMRGLSI